MRAASLDDWIIAALVAAPFALFWGVWVNAATWWPVAVILAITAIAQAIGTFAVIHPLRAGRI